MDLLIDGLESRKSGEKFHDFVLDDAIHSIKRAKEKLRQQDVIWKGICGELKWEYIPTC
jgi:hypothetical protein